VKEAGIIIGRNGAVIADIRDQTNVKAGVSQVVQGTPDRILTVTGALDDTAKALGLIAQALLSNPLDESLFQYFPLKRLLPPGPEGSMTLRLLVPNAQMGTIIGKQGARIKELQQNYNVKIVASKDFLHNSTERLVEMQGTPDAIEDATKILARCLMEDWHSITGTSYYTPTPRMGGNRRASNSNEETRTVQFPSEMVGCLIGKAGSRIQEIRKVSGAQITIAPSDDADGQRQFTLVGPSRSIDKALSFLNQNMEREQERRARLAESQE
jgi:heterogeneous nuclear rnp K-like protein 2